MKNVFIIGSKGIPSKYGGFETFVDKLTANKINSEIKYHVSCLSQDNNEFYYNDARCFNVKVPNIGPAKAVYYDVKSLDKVYKYIKENNIENATVYILACRIGPFIKVFTTKLTKLGVRVFVNPDGHEWKRAKWNWVIRKYWKFSERLMIKNSDLIICDSTEIEKYIKSEYKEYAPITKYIAYGASVTNQNNLNHKKYLNWLQEWHCKNNEYYLIVGRFVEENNYELILKEFMKSETNKSLIIITNVEKNKFYNELQKKTHFNNDNRIKFVGTIYDGELLSQVRMGAFGYIHGHEVGGTNPSLLEAMATTSLNFLLDVKFNREVGGDCSLYFTKKEGDLANIINEADVIADSRISELGSKAKHRINEKYSWDKIVKEYEECFWEC